MALIVTAVDAGNDVLIVTASDGAGGTWQAQGWISSIRNHYSASAYDVNGNLKAGATPTQMSNAEIRAYVRSLLLAAHPELAAAQPAAQAPLLSFSDPTLTAAPPPGP